MPPHSILVQGLSLLSQQSGPNPGIRKGTALPKGGAVLAVCRAGAEIGGNGAVIAVANILLLRGTASMSVHQYPEKTSRFLDSWSH